jgi:hypothetical protein
VVIGGRCVGFLGRGVITKMPWRSRFLAAAGLHRTVVPGGGCGCGQGDGVTVRVGLQLGDGERGKATWRACGARRNGLERKAGVWGVTEPSKL